jgi:hypothetical protein
VNEGQMKGKLTRVFTEQGQLSGESFWSFYMNNMFICKMTLDDCLKSFPYLVYDDMNTKEFGLLMIKKLKHMKAFW